MPFGLQADRRIDTLAIDLCDARPRGSTAGCSRQREKVLCRGGGQGENQRENYQARQFGDINGEHYQASEDVVHAATMQQTIYQFLNGLDLPRQRRGVRPVKSRTASVMCAWSEKPESTAILAKELFA